jgi:hypothetical protein
MQGRFYFIQTGKIMMKKATPVWLKGKSEDMNIAAGFRAVFKKGADTGGTVLTNGSFLFQRGITYWRLK